MATNIDKALYQQPQGIEELAQDAEPIEIEIVDPEEVNIDVGDLELSIRPGEDEEGFDANLADIMPESAIESLASDLDSDIKNDVGSRKEWEKAYVEGLKLLGLQYEERTEPWNGACGVFHPMITRLWFASSRSRSQRRSRLKAQCAQRSLAKRRRRNKKPPCESKTT